ncbi:CK1 family protein kinase [Histomonas meleagridis]|uniref:CK1 family protein kinase n=1 Tax=Histomonas meleagridis TaxID=135588 RepID=UPI0035593C54|nr:CK1 family protein kinase [Histomonas meleagridis]KAH0805776.1 CK1 family protein kinase [Histomonas meleagridis]
MDTETEVFPKGTKISHYKIASLIGRGGFGNVYKVIETTSGEAFALKTELSSVNESFLKNETKCLKKNRCKCFPIISETGTFKNVQYYIMPLYGQSLSEIRKESNGKLEPAIAFPLIYQMYLVIKKLHEKGYIHRDIKPGNFLVQNDRKYPLVLIDFGLAELHIDFETNQPFQAKESNPFKGTKNYASPYAHLRKPMGRRDDLISWYYSSIELLTGQLPWRECETIEEMREMKKSMTAAKLCKGITKSFCPIYQHLINLKYNSQPSYTNIENQLKIILKELNISLNQINWELFYRQHAGFSKESSESNSEAENKEDCVIQ